MEKHCVEFRPKFVCCVSGLFDCAEGEYLSTLVTHSSSGIYLLQEIEYIADKKIVFINEELKRRTLSVMRRSGFELFL